MSPPEAVLFDNDGLFLDTETVWTRGEKQLFEAHGFEFTSDHKLALVGSSEKIAAAKLARFLDLPGDGMEVMQELNGLVLKELEAGVEAMAGARELVGELNRRQIPTALVSNSPMTFILKSHEMAETGLPFGAVVSAHEVPMAKPAPDAYLEGCLQLGVEPSKRSVALEDSPSGVIAAAAAGLFVIGIPSVPGIELERADLIATSLEDPLVAEKLLG